MPPKILLAPNMQPEVQATVRPHYTLFDLTGYATPAEVPGLDPTEIRGVVTRGESLFGADLMDALPNLEIISNFGVGYDGIDALAAKARGVMLTHTPDILTDETANTALVLALDVTRRISESDRFVRAGKWPTGEMPLATSIIGKTAGILGFGRIGQALARRLEASGMGIAYSDLNPAEGVAHPYYPDPVGLAAACDLLFVCCIGGAPTRNLVNAEVLAALGPSGYLINAARGSIVHEAALVEALEKGTIAGAGIDVFADEPNVPPALMAMDNVVLLPHVGSSTVETRQRMADLTLANLDRHFAGEPVLTPVPQMKGE